MAYRLVLAAVTVAALSVLSACPTWFGGGGTSDPPDASGPVATGSTVNSDGNGAQSSDTGETDPGETDTGGTVTVIVEYVGAGETVDADNPIIIEAEDASGNAIDYALETDSGNAVLENVPDGEYSVTVYIDVDDDGVAGATAEPSLTIAGITVTEGSDESLHFVLDDVGAQLTVETYLTYSGDSVVGPTSPIVLSLDSWAGELHVLRFHATRAAAILGSVSKTVFFADYFLDSNDNGFPDVGEPVVTPQGGVNYGGKSGIVVERIDITD